MNEIDDVLKVLKKIPTAQPSRDLWARIEYSLENAKQVQPQYPAQPFLLRPALGLVFATVLLVLVCNFSFVHYQRMVLDTYVWDSGTHLMVPEYTYMYSLEGGV